MYDLEVERVLAEVEGSSRILVQAPDGIKPYLGELLDALSRVGEVLLSGSHAWGGCDIAVEEARRVGAECIVHVGHHGPVRVELPRDIRVVFVPAYCRAGVARAVESALDQLGECERVGLLCSIQHAREVPRAAEILRREGVEVVVGRAGDPRMAAGQVIGCDVSAAVSIAGKVDAFLVVAGGFFHAAGVYAKTGTRTLALDPFRGSAVDVEEYVRRKYALHLDALCKASEARELGVIVCTKPGQCRLAEALRARELLERAGRRAQLVVLGDVDGERLANLGLEAFVNTACPRLSFDDQDRLGVPVVWVGELEYVLGREISEHELREVF